MSDFCLRQRDISVPNDRRTEKRFSAQMKGKFTNMIKSLYSGVTGLKSHNQRMDVIGNNIANVNTTAYKAGTVTFKDVYYQTRQRASGGDFVRGGVNPMQVGLGVQLGTIGKVMTQSGLTYSDSVFDCALEGSGFFQVMDQVGNVFYTRLGRFSLDDFGNLVDPNGNMVLGVSGDPTGVIASQQRINIHIPDIPDQRASYIEDFIVDHNSYSIMVRAGQYGPGGNMGIKISHSATSFATMSGSSGLSVQMDLTKDYRAIAVDNLAAGGNPEPTLSTPPTPAEMLALARWEELLVNEISALFQYDLNEAIRIGGVSVDPALLPLEVEFGAVPSVTAAQNATNYRRIPGTDIDLEFTVTAPGAAGNRYEISMTTFAGSGSVQAQWRGNVLEIKLPADRLPGAEVTAAEIQAAITRAGTNPATTAGTYGVYAVGDIRPDGTTVGAGDLDIGTPKPAAFQPIIVISGGTKDHVLAVGDPHPDTGVPLVAGDPLIGVTIRVPINPNTDGINFSGVSSINATRVGMANGEDSFFQKAFTSLNNMALRGGSYQGPQTPDTAEIFIDRDGIIYGEHPVHGILLLGRIDIVDFVNPEGLKQVGTSYFSETLNSGPAMVKIPQTESETYVISGALEMSNVDLSNEFSDMIITQRGFQANSRIITVSDSMLEELVNLKR